MMTSTKNQKVISKNCGVVFWHEAHSSVSVRKLAEIFTQYGEEAPQQLGVRNAFTQVETAFGRKSSSTVFLRRVPATVAKDSRREMLDVLEVLPSLNTVSGRDYEVLGQLWLQKTTGPGATYTLGVTCDHGETELVKDDQDLRAIAGCPCKVWTYVPRLLAAWFSWRGPEAMLDGSFRGQEYRKLYAKYGAISLAENGRPFYFPAETFVPWQIVEAVGDRVYCLPLNPEAAKDLGEVTYRVFFDELQAMEDEVSAWDATVRKSTKQRRLEALDEARKRAAMYGVILGEAIRELEGLAKGIQTRIEETLFGTAQVSGDENDGEAEIGGVQ